MASASPAPTIRDFLHDALLEQARRDLKLGELEACSAKLGLLLKDVDGDRACAALVVRMLYALSTGAAHEADNIAYYLSGALATARRRPIIADGLARLADWPVLSTMLQAIGLDAARPDPDALIASLAARARPREDPTWSEPVAASPATAASRPVVVLTLVNGLGNQLFQYAAALRRARRAGASLKIDLSVLAMPQYYNRPYGLDAFAIEAPVADADDTGRADRHPHAEDIARFDARIMSGSGDARLIGCWASPVYFRGVEAEVRRQFQFRDPGVSARARATIARLRRGDAPVIGMHVRRGDYLLPAFHNSFAAHPIAYYRAALARFPADSTVVVFSDTPEDRDWCAQAFGDLGTRLEVSRDRSDIDEFALLAACEHQITSVSSFGWWAAWLNPNPAKRIVAPHPAIGHGPRTAYTHLALRTPPDWCVLDWDEIGPPDR
jgi:hypothetical protein